MLGPVSAEAYAHTSSLFRKLDCSKWWLGELRCSEMRALVLTAEAASPW